MDTNHAENPLPSSSERIAYIDVLKFIAIYLVFVGHLGKTFINPYIWTFHMPLFFFISGMLFKNSTVPFIEFVFRKFKAYMVPYFFFVILSILCFVLTSNKTATITPVSWKNMLSFFLEFCFGARNKVPFAGSLWFLPALFVLSVFFDALNRILSRLSAPKRLAGLLITVYLIHFIVFIYSYPPPPGKNFWSFAWAAYYSLYFGWGHLFSCWERKLKEGGKLTTLKARLGLTVLLFLLGWYACVLCFKNQNLLAFIHVQSTNFLIRKFTGGLFLHLSALVLIAFTIFIAHFFSSVTLFARMGRNTLYMCGNEYIAKLIIPNLLTLVNLKLVARTSMDMYLYAFALLLFCNFVLVPLQKGILENLQRYFQDCVSPGISRIFEAVDSIRRKRKEPTGQESK